MWVRFVNPYFAGVEIKNSCSAAAPGRTDRGWEDGAFLHHLTGQPKTKKAIQKQDQNLFILGPVS